MNAVIAIVRDKETKNITHIKSTYKSKNHFANDIRANGYSVLTVLTLEQASSLIDSSTCCSLIAKTPKDAVHYLRKMF